jgi:hypothetical protein
MPSGFWKKFCKKYIVADKSDQGAWGGHRTMVWQTETPDYFDKEKIISFAWSNGWTLTDSSLIFSNQTKSWYANDTKMDAPFEDATTAKWLNTDMKILKFDSKMMIESSLDSAKFTPAYGYVFVNADKNEMIMFEKWGE